MPGSTGLLVAAWLSEDKIVQIGCIFLLLVPASLIAVFMFIIRGPPKPKSDVDVESAPGSPVCAVPAGLVAHGWVEDGVDAEEKRRDPREPGVGSCR